MSAYGEHIEAYLDLEDSTAELSDHDVAEGVADIVFAQGGVKEAEVDLLVHQIEAEVPYYRSG